MALDDSSTGTRSMAASGELDRPRLSPLRVMGAVWPAAWSETEVATVLHRLEEQAVSFRHGHVLVKSFGLWHTHAVQGGALRYAAAQRVSALLRATMKRWRTVARESSEMFFARAWFAEHCEHWAMVAAIRRWHEAAVWLAYTHRAMLVGRKLGALRLRASAYKCWRQVTISLQRLREGCDALCWEHQRGVPHQHFLPCHSFSHTNLKSPCVEQVLRAGCCERGVLGQAAGRC
jgi:hypothetical protein|eukprot:COSAG03_NODE_5546_length_1223_cov_1.583630_2_plen_233_part_00